MDQPPKIPTDLHGNGSEIWAWGRALSDYTQRLDKTRKLRARISTIGNECGDCDKWMKSSLCPREKNVNGRNKGPSCGAYICGQFVETASATKRRQDLSAELAAFAADTKPQRS